MKAQKFDSAISSSDCIAFSRKAILWWLPVLYLLVSDAFYLRTYDSAQVKITLVQMGGVSLIALWLCRLLEEGLFSAFSKDDLLCLAPFLASLAYGVFSFIHAPYHWSSTDFFLRRIFYMTVPLIVIREFDERAIRRLVRFLILSAWISAGYGLLQWVDIYFFPPGIGKGIDPFIWRHAFSARVFSTYGNPNFLADFLVLMLPIIFSQFLKSRELKLLVLMGIHLFVIYGTQTKGAWIALAITGILYVGTYLFFFDRQTLLQYWRRIVCGMAAVFAAALVAVWIKLQGSFTSVNFRLFTWEATWEMIMTQPLIGTGLGSFWVIYPAFRRPPIFHIEGKHNTETDHAENEFLEVLFDEGILGFGIFLWLMLSTWAVAYRALSNWTRGLIAGQRAPPRAYELLGFLVAFQGMLAHNFFDVSLRFVSSGVYLGLLSGVVVNLSRGVALADLKAVRAVPPAAPLAAPPGEGLLQSLSAFFLWPARLGAWGCLAYVGYRLIQQFSELQGPLFRLTLGGEVLQWWISWICFLACVFGLGVAFARIAGLARNALVPMLIALTMLPVNLAWGFFRADVYHNIAIFFSKQQNWEQALRHYFKVGELNPAYVMSFYFKGNVFNDRFNMEKIYNPDWGDKDNVARDDFERAFAAYEEVRARAPNYVQMHHQVGVLYLKRGDWHMRNGREEEGQRDWDMALKRFEMYRNLDPIFPPNFYRMGQIYMARRQYDKAIEMYQAQIDGEKCQVVPWLAQNDFLRRTILSYQRYTNIDGLWVHRHDYWAEGYTHLANALFMAGRLPEAQKAYQRALELDPQAATAARNLEVVQSRLRAVPPKR